MVYKVGRPRTALLDRDRIADAALAMIDDTGDFALPALARVLNVQTASLYHHVPGRAGLIELLRDRVTADIDATVLRTEPWDAGLRALARSYRDAFARHPRLVPLLATTTVRNPAVIEAYDAMVGLLTDVGFRAEEIIDVLTALENLIIGSALDLAAPEVMWEIPDDTPAPRLAAALAAAPTGPDRADRAFEAGLTALITGFKTLLEER